MKSRKPIPRVIEGQDVISLFFIDAIVFLVKIQTNYKIMDKNTETYTLVLWGKSVKESAT